MTGTIDVVYEYPEGGEKLTHIVGRDGKTTCGFEGDTAARPSRCRVVHRLPAGRVDMDG